MFPRKWSLDRGGSQDQLITIDRLGLEVEQGGMAVPSIAMLAAVQDPHRIYGCG
jgi:hypothetical protein